MVPDSESDVVTLIPRFVITPGAPPVREASNPGDNRSSHDDVSDTLLPADVEPYQATRPLPARSMLRRMPPTKVL